MVPWLPVPIVVRLDTQTETEYHLAVSEAIAVQNALDDAGYRLTEARRSIADLIARRDGHFTAAP